MQQSDYLLREIERISILLMGMLGKMVRRKKEGVELNEDEYTALTIPLPEDAVLQIDFLLTTDKSDFEKILKIESGFDDKNIENLADLLCAIAEISTENHKTSLLRKALELYNYLDIKGRIYSFERASKISKSEKLLDDVR